MNISFTVQKINETCTLPAWDELPETTRTFLATYGARQFVNDAHAAVKRGDFTTDAEYHSAVRAKYAKRLDQILSGNVPGTRAAADPRAALVRAVLAKLPADTNVSVDDVVAAITKLAA